MDINGVHIDGAVLLALIALVNTVILILTNRTVTRTHDAVNGMQQSEVDAAHQRGVDEAASSIENR